MTDDAHTDATKKRRIAVLICGIPPSAVLQQAGDYGEQFSQLLQQSAHLSDEDWQFWNAYKGELPSEEELAAFDAIVVTGGAGDAFSNEAWVVASRDLVKAAHLRKQRMLGVCFGHQLIAKALGGTVGRAPEWDIGAAKIRFEPAAPQQLGVQDLPQEAVINISHRDQVQELPEGAAQLASSDACPLAVYSVGSHILCLQGHPEFSRQTVEAIVDAHQDDHLMHPQHIDSTAKSYADLGPQLERDVELLRRICCGHLRKP